MGICWATAMRLEIPSFTSRVGSSDVSLDLLESFVVGCRGRYRLKWANGAQDMPRGAHWWSLGLEEVMPISRALSQRPQKPVMCLLQRCRRASQGKVHEFI
jgi:hypothetical protein